MLKSEIVKMSEDEKAKRISVTLKPEVIKELDDFAEQWGVSRSGMISVLVKLRKLDTENYWASVAEEADFSEKMRKEFGVKRKNRV